MTTLHFDTSEVDELARDLAAVPSKVPRRVGPILGRNARELKDLWKSNAVATARSHGKLYPLTITVYGGGMAWEIHPNQGMPQGGMAFEYGGPSVIRNPAASGRGGSLGQRVGQNGPHLDGNRAADVIFPKVGTGVADAVESCF